MRLVLIERAVDARELLGDQRIGAAAPLDGGEALVVRLLEGLEGAHEVLEGRADVGRPAFVSRSDVMVMCSLAPDCVARHPSRSRACATAERVAASLLDRAGPHPAGP